MVPIKMKLAATDCKILDEDVPPSLANLSLAHCLLQVSFSLSFLPGCLLPLCTPLKHALLKSAGLNPHNDMDMPLSFMLPCPLRDQKQGAKELLQGCPWPAAPLAQPPKALPCPAPWFGGKPSREGCLSMGHPTILHFQGPELSPQTWVRRLILFPKAH